MSFLKKIQQPLFWSNFLKVFLPFLVFVAVIHLFMNSWREIFDADFSTVSKMNFDNGKWIHFFGIKLIISFFYALYITNKNMKS